MSAPAGSGLPAASAPDEAGAEQKTACVNLYAQPGVQMLIGSSWHPGGLGLTRQAAAAVGLTSGDRLVDVACGAGTSVVALAAATGCEAVGLDLSAAALQQARERAARAGAGGRVRFVEGDAEWRPDGIGVFTVALCECAYSTFPDKAAAAGALFDLLAPGGRIALTDVTADRDRLPPEVRTALGAAACVADVRTPREYQALLEGAGFREVTIQDASATIRDLLRSAGWKLLLAQAAGALGIKLAPGLDVKEARRWVGLFEEAVAAGSLGYALITARRP